MISWATLTSSFPHVGKLLLSLGCGFAIGTERQFSKKHAGMRTCSLVCMGSTLFTLMSYLGLQSIPDSGRHIAAQIVSGVGFLCAGSIMVQQNKIVGLTTAGIVWVVAAIGMAIGYGFYVLGIVATVLVLSVVFAFGLLERKLKWFKR